MTAGRSSRSRSAAWPKRSAASTSAETAKLAPLTATSASGSRTSSRPAASAGPIVYPRSADRPVERRCGRHSPLAHETRQRRERRGAEQSGARARHGGQDDRGLDARDERDAGERAGPHDVGHDHAGSLGPAIGGGPEDGPEQHGRNQVREQHEADRPRRLEALVGDQDAARRSPRPSRRRTGRERERSTVRGGPRGAAGWPGARSCLCPSTKETAIYAVSS